MKLKSLGSDPELFLLLDEEVVSAIGKVGGTKKRPKKIGENFFIQEDNVLVEFNIPASESSVDFAKNMQEGLRLVKLALPAGYEYVAKGSHVMDKSQLKSRKARTFGCEPDMIAWTGEEMLASMPTTGLRTAGGHVHVGYDEHDEATNFKIAKALDIYLGLPSVLLDSDTDRRTVYGGAGAFRHKPYGLEYRTLSSFWVTDEILCRWVFNQVEAALENINIIDNLSINDKYDIMFAINFSDGVLAKTLIEKYNVKMP